MTACRRGHAKGPGYCSECRRAGRLALLSYDSVVAAAAGLTIGELAVKFGVGEQALRNWKSALTAEQKLTLNKLHKRPKIPFKRRNRLTVAAMRQKPTAMPSTYMSQNETSIPTLPFSQR